MYSKLKACVRLDSNYSDIFTCNVGHMQVGSVSPLLYSLYVNDIEVELINQGCQSYELKKIELIFINVCWRYSNIQWKCGIFTKSDKFCECHSQWSWLICKSK
jgi:hypothetical protein